MRDDPSFDEVFVDWRYVEMVGRVRVDGAMDFVSRSFVAEFP